jgi:hypothetical protein
METNTLVEWVALAFLTAIASGCGGSQTEPRAPDMRSSNSDYHLASNAPQDRPFGADPGAVDQLEQGTAPLVRQARETYPDAKRRFLTGLPPGEVFFVTARLRDERGRFEQVFVHVEHIVGDVIAGSLASDINLVRHYKRGDHFELKEGELVDWLISKPDGSEEGNLVGKYLDKLQEQGSTNPP